MRSLVFALLFCFAALPAMATIDTLPPPVVVVYPLLVTGNTSQEAGGRLAVLFASRLASAGGISVKPATPGTDRAHYLEAARALGADYYVTGFIAPLGNEVSLVDQIVSTYSGIVVWSNTTQVRTYDEAAGQADVMRSAILRHAGRTLAALDAPKPIPSATATPAAEAGNLSRIFSRKPKPSAAPKPPATATPRVGATPTAAAALAVATSAATPAPATASGTAIVVEVGGDADGAGRTYATKALSAAIARAGLGGALASPSTNADVAAHARDLCRSHGAAAIYSGTLSLRRLGGGFIRGTKADFELLRYDCAGAITSRQREQTQASARAAAIDRAVAKTVGATLRAAGRP